MAMGVAPKAAPVSLLVLVVAACGDDDGSSPASAPQGLCSSLQSRTNTLDAPNCSSSS
jgi:hypothetical protein